MLLACCVALLLALIPGAAATLVRRYEQCGGKNWTGPTQCKRFNSCEYFNEYYSQCRPTNIYPSNIVGWYGQCGGQEYSGATRCEADSTCVVDTVWYSQCLPTYTPR
jgi:lytic cellulose monooxygenase (C1-hydroxylating)